MHYVIAKFNASDVTIFVSAKHFIAIINYQFLFNLMPMACLVDYYLGIGFIWQAFLILQENFLTALKIRILSDLLKSFFSHITKFTSICSNFIGFLFQPKFIIAFSGNIANPFLAKTVEYCRLNQTVWRKICLCFGRRPSLKIWQGRLWWP